MKTQKSTLTLRAYAKVNLYLDMIGRMENGYHEIRSVMQSIGLYDDISFIMLSAGKGIRLTSDNRELPCDRRNLAFRAAEALGEAAGLRPDVQIHIEKRIPMAAGMAGGSSDAAVVLLGLNRLFGLGLDRERLCAIGKTLGADVPFCLLGGAALAGGIGEKLTPCRPLPEQAFLVVACGGTPVYTPAAYRALDEKYGDFGGRRKQEDGCQALLRGLEAGALDEICGHLYNIFEEVVLPDHDMAPLLLRLMREKGADGALMSGSGPTVFGLFARQQTAEDVAESIRTQFGIKAWVVHPAGPYEI